MRSFPWQDNSRISLNFQPITSQKAKFNEMNRNKFTKNTEFLGEVNIAMYQAVNIRENND